jgi:hypothetical protein
MHARPPLSPEAIVVDQLRTRWLAAIVESGPIAARNDAVVAFMQRMGCTRAAAEELVDRAWSMLNLDVHAPRAGAAHEAPPRVELRPAIQPG